MKAKAKATTMAALAAMLMASPSQGADYTLDLSGSVFPPGVTVSNETGTKPYAGAYKRGYTTEGWTIDRYGTYGYVAVSPTYTETTTACKNVLALPELTIGEGDRLRWHAVSVHPDRKEKYSVVATDADSGEVVTLYSTDEEVGEWSARSVNLSSFAGKKLTISFVCESENRFLLALGNVTVGVPTDTSFECRQTSGVYCDAAAAATGHTPLTVEITNTGRTLTGGEIQFDYNYEPESSQTVEGTWETGETRTYTFDAPVRLNRRSPVQVFFNDGANRTQLLENTLYCSTFTKRLLVDKGTGMWCVNCPAGTLSIEEAERHFGNSMVLVETHNGDILAEDSYFGQLNFHSLPYMTLNRLKNSGGSNANNFEDFYYRKAEFGIDFIGAEVTGNETATLKVRVRCGDGLDNSAERYRIGYVMTGNFHKDEQVSRWYQKNDCSAPTAYRYYYLPSVIIAPLVYFNNVTLTSDHAFDGFSGSLPAELVSGKDYEYEWEVERPELLEDLKAGRVVAYVLDTESGEAINCAEINLDGSGFVGIDNMQTAAGDRKISMTVNADGSVSVAADEECDFTIEAWTLDGRKAATVSGHAAPTATVQPGLGRGAYVLRLTSQLGNATAKTVRF